ncbi:hypothetical protein [Marinilactibacillus kalidii]|uniref:hypothetical protein n=1 Tax=Marinilactibacillus kalidii TaxID=2820274 RepID=UPI001ABDD83C|nr:hypothetical protein [Marinilactibacillus kalidii]
MRKSDGILVRWLLEQSGLSLLEIASNTAIDQNTLITLKQGLSGLNEIDDKISKKLIQYAKKVGAE